MKNHELLIDNEVFKILNFINVINPLLRDNTKNIFKEFKERNLNQVYITIKYFYFAFFIGTPNKDF